MRESRVIKIEGRMEIIGIFVNGILTSTMRRRIFA
jgi:hypothetical protein